MRIPPYIVIVLALACQNNESQNESKLFQNQTIEFTDIIFDLPVSLKFDTSYKWIVDDKCHEELKVYVNRNYYQFNYADTLVPFTDTIFRFLISVTCNDVGIEPNDSILDNEVMKRKQEMPSLNIIRNEILTVSGYKFTLFAFENYNENKKKWFKSLHAFSVINDKIISFSFDCLAGNCDNFINECQYSFENLKIKL